MKSPYRKGIQITVSNAAVQAAAALVSSYYRGANPQAVKALLNVASEIVDEIEARAETPMPIQDREAA